MGKPFRTELRSLKNLISEAELVLSTTTLPEGQRRLLETKRILLASEFDEKLQSVSALPPEVKWADWHLLFEQMKERMKIRSDELLAPSPGLTQ